MNCCELNGCRGRCGGNIRKEITIKFVLAPFAAIALGAAMVFIFYSPPPGSVAAKSQAVKHIRKQLEITPVVTVPEAKPQVKAESKPFPVEVQK